MNEVDVRKEGDDGKNVYTNLHPDYSLAQQLMIRRFDSYIERARFSRIPFGGGDFPGHYAGEETTFIQSLLARFYRIYNDISPVMSLHLRVSLADFIADGRCIMRCNTFLVSCAFLVETPSTYY
jgi:hypothetical protein